MVALVLICCGACADPSYLDSGAGAHGSAGSGQEAGMDGSNPDASSCVPKTCTELGVNCGQQANGCGAVIDCGTCTAPQTCGGGGTPNACGVGSPCIKKTCVDFTAGTCGQQSDGCGGLVSCATCTAPQTCGGGGTPNVCGAPQGSCLTGDGSWSHSQSFAVQTGTFTASFDATPSQSSIDGLVGFSQGPAAGYTDLASIVRFGDTGTLDARDGAAYSADTAIPYTAGGTYHFRLVVNVASHVYSAYVTPPGGTEVAIGSSYAFRTEQASVAGLDHVDANADIGSETVCNFSIQTSSGGGTGGTGGTSGAGGSGGATGGSGGATGGSGGATGGSGGFAGSDSAPTGTTWYVSKNGSGADGKSWATAWKELSDINWSAIAPGDTVVIDGGASKMTYNSTVQVGASGTASSPVTVRAGISQGHTGEVEFFGGRSTPLPECAQQNYTYQTNGVSSNAIVVGNHAYVVFDGMRAAGFVIHGYNGAAILPSDSSDHITFRNMEIYDNGTAFRGSYSSGSAHQSSSGPWNPAGPNIELQGTNLTFERMNVHDAGEDSFQSSGGFGNLTLHDVWLHNQRQHSSVAGPNSDWPAPGPASYNYCAHTDGLQVYAGGNISGVSINGAVIGPGTMNGLIIGGATVDNVNITDTLFLNNSSNGIITDSVTGWNLKDVTMYEPTCALELSGSGNTIQDSVFSGGCLETGGITFTNDCYWNTGGSPSGTRANPDFVGPIPSATANFSSWESSDFSLGSGSACPGGIGSHITSVAQIKAAMGY
jgi:hypothetical protein